MIADSIRKCHSEKELNGISFMVTFDQRLTPLEREYIRSILWSQRLKIREAYERRHGYPTTKARNRRLNHG